MTGQCGLEAKFPAFAHPARWKIEDIIRRYPDDRGDVRLVDVLAGKFRYIVAKIK
jgi:hypothetical protein